MHNRALHPQRPQAVLVGFVCRLGQAEERDRLLSAIARNEHVEPGVRIRAIVELNRCSGRHSVKHFHEGELTLEQVLGESRQVAG